MRKIAVLTALSLCAFTILLASSASADRLLEAETGTLSGSAAVVSDSLASGSKAARLYADNVRVRLTYSGSIVSLRYTTRATQCSGAPKAALYVDGARIAGINVSNSSSYSSWTLDRSVPEGTHTLDVVMENDLRTDYCNRSLYVDKIGVVGASGTTETVSVPAHDTRWSNGVTKLHLDDTKDYIVKLPPEKKVGGLQIYGGDAITIVGGHITANPDHTTQNGSLATIGLYVKKTTSGPVHVEGVLFNDSAGGQMDAIATNTPNATVTLKNIRALVSGSVDQVHASCYSGYWDVGRLNVDGFTCYTNLYGFYLHGNGPVDMKNVNMGYRDSPFMNTAAGKILAITSEGSDVCTTQGLTISGPVYIYPPRPGLEAPDRYLWPNTAKPAGCPSTVSNNYVTWPNLSRVSGGVYLKAPPNGDFVPAGTAGVGYAGGG